MTVQIPDEMQLIAVELELDIGETAEDATEFENIREWMCEQIHERKNEAIEHFDDLEAQLNHITIKQPTE
jgi:hypothetical protein